MTSTPGPGWLYLPALDGIRALAVSAVVLFHYWPGTFSGGFIGVDVFFVMSGYLITGILMQEWRVTGTVALAEFWRRRARRLVPAVLVLVALTTVGSYLAGGWSTRQFANSVGALTWTTNIVETVFGTSRVFTRNPDTVLDHLWSLAIEEQFYLLWPPALALLLRRVASVRARLTFVAAGIAASATLMGLVGVFASYFRTDTRAFELLMGAGIALAAARLPVRSSAAVSLAAAAGLVWFVFAAGPGDRWMYPWGFLGVTALAGALVAAAANPSAPVAAVLGFHPIRVIGQRSYGVYLWHIPVYRVLSAAVVGIDGVPLMALRFSALAVLVEASYRFIEQPVRSGRVRLGPGRWALAYLTVGLLLVPVAMVAVRETRAQWDSETRPPSVRSGQTKVIAIGDVIGFGSTVGVANRGEFALWSLVDASCPSVTVGEFRLRGRPFPVDDFCRHWADRARRAVDAFDPDVVLIGFGHVDTLELVLGGNAVGGPELEREYRRAIREQIASASRRSARVIMVRVDDPSALFDPLDRAPSSRSEAARVYLRAFDGVVADNPAVSVLRVEGTPRFGELADDVDRQLASLLGD